MAFTHKHRSAVPALDLEGLVKLLSAPQKAAELWQVYTQHREAYEAQRASIAAELELVAKREAASVDLAFEISKGQADFEKEKQAFTNKKEAWTSQHNEVQTQLAARAAELDARDTFFQSKERELNKDRSEFNEWQKARQALATKYDSEYLERVAELIDREAAVAVREKKAEELAKLLKGV